MGTWGHGNFENDTAADHLCELCAPLLDQIRTAVEDKTEMEPDEPTSDWMMANVEILAVLGENIGRTGKDWVGDFAFPFPLPDPDEVDSWKQAYLEVWDGDIDDLEPSPEYKTNRRATIVATFDRLAKAAASGPPIGPEAK